MKNYYEILGVAENAPTTEVVKIGRKLLEEYVNEHFKFYDGDLKQFKTLAQAKADVDTAKAEAMHKVNKFFLISALFM